MPERAGRQRSCLVYLLAALCLTASSLSRSDLIPSRHRHHRLEQLCPTPEPFAALMGDQGRNGYRFLKAEASASRGPKTYKYRAEAPGGSLLTWQQALQLWQQQDSGFAEDFAAELRSSEFKAFFFETPPLTPRNLGDIFEFVLADSPKLAQVTKPDTGAFEQHLASDVSVFRNLGGDAVLVSPRQVSGIDALTYVHLANYVRGAPPQQVLLLWAEVGSAVEKRVSEMKGKPVWLSTSGLGVYWLHVRLDSTPKYYTYDPYKRCRAAGPN